MTSPSTGQAGGEHFCIPDLPTLCLNSCGQEAREHPKCWVSSLGVLQWIMESRLKKCVELELHLAGREQAVVRLGIGRVQLGSPSPLLPGVGAPLSCSTTSWGAMSPSTDDTGGFVDSAQSLYLADPPRRPVPARPG